MKFAIIDPAARTVTRVDAKDVTEVYAMVGLNAREVDHGVLTKTANGGAVGYVVYEFGFFLPAAEQHFYHLAGRLIAGASVLYAFDETGVTVDLADDVPIDPVWFESPAEVEVAIREGAIVRPQIALNGVVIWSWPSPAPPEMAARVAKRGRR